MPGYERGSAGIQPKDANRFISSRNAQQGIVVAQEDFNDSQTNYHNDGIGYGYRDSDVVFGNKNTLRLELGGDGTTITGTSNSPGTAPGPTTQVVCKRRISNFNPGFSGRWQYEYWYRMTSGGIGGNMFITTSIYDRDGTNIYLFRFWFDQVGIPTTKGLKVLNSGGTYDNIDPNANFDIAHTYEPLVSSFDKGGIWHYVRIVVDFPSQFAIEMQLDNKTYQLQSAGFGSARVEANTNAKALHFSHELGYNSNSAVRRYYNIAEPVIINLAGN